MTTEKYIEEINKLTRKALLYSSYGGKEIVEDLIRHINYATKMYDKKLRLKITQINSALISVDIKPVWWSRYSKKKWNAILMASKIRGKDLNKMFVRSDFF